MDGKSFDALTRRAAAAVSRRGSLLAISGAALGATVAAPTLVAAKGCGKKCQRKCRKQVDKCKEEVREFCGDLPPIEGKEEACLEAFNECCEHLGSCNAGQSTACFLDHVIFIFNAP